MSKRETKKQTKPFVIGILCNGFNYTDIKAYNSQFKQINKEFKKSVTLMFIGYSAEHDTVNSLEGVIFKFTKSVSIAHFYKHTKALNINLLFIPLVRNRYNEMSENYNKWLEATMLGIPVITLNMFPYGRAITNNFTGLLFNTENDFFDRFKEVFVNDIAVLEYVAKNAQNVADMHFSYSAENVVELNNAIE